jgi:DNA-binding NarL/FixJ family response regulator
MIKALIAEDNTLFGQAFKDSLRTRFPSMIIEVIEDGNEVLQKVDDFLPHLIFMDIRLPGKNGLELTKEIKSVHPDMIVIIMTSYNLPEYRDAALKYGVAHFIPKDSSDMKEIETLIKSFHLE